MIIITPYVIFVWESAILDFTLLKIILWISRVNKLYVASPELYTRLWCKNILVRKLFQFFF